MMKEILLSLSDAAEELLPAKKLVAEIRPSVLTSDNKAIEKIDALIQLLKLEPGLKEKFSGYILQMIRSKDCVDAFCESGILPGTTFWAGLLRRITHKIVPELYEENDLRTAIVNVFSSKTDAKWLKSVPVEKWSELFAFIEIKADDQKLLQNEIANALVILSHRITSLGLEPEISSKLPHIDKLSSPFITQSDEIIQLAQKIDKGYFDLENMLLDYKQINVLLDQCETIISDLRNHKNDYGASVSLTYILVRLQQHIKRVKLLLKILFKEDVISNASVALLLYEVVKAEHEKNSIIGYVNNNIDLIAYQVAEHGSKNGHHYITSTKKEYNHLFASSMKGGFIVGFMAMFKVLIHYISMAPAWYALSYSLNYAWGFVTMQVTHSALATKQPALTAQTIASVVHHDVYHEKKLDGIGEMVARVSRSQLASFAGNLMVVFPMGMLVAFIFSLVTGSDLADAKKAELLITELHPFKSGSLLFASIAGIYLFLTGIVSGYVDNLVIYRNIPMRVQKHFVLQRIFNTTFLGKISRYVEKNLGGIVGNIFFGFCMGSTATIGHFFGLGLDVRHITFAAANFGISLVSFDFSLSFYHIFWTIMGIIGIGFFNFMVSFNLAFYVALKARGVVVKDTFKILKISISHLLKNPRSFVLPPTDITSQ